jgi:hypothetical protein
LTRRGDVLYATILGQPPGTRISFSVPGLPVQDVEVTQVAEKKRIEVQQKGEQLTLCLAEPLEKAPAHSFSISAKAIA